jgi:hypothetical protein
LETFQIEKDNIHKNNYLTPLTGAENFVFLEQNHEIDFLKEAHLSLYADTTNNNI